MKVKQFSLLTIGVAALILAGCDEGPDEDVRDFPDPAGFDITLDGAPIVTYEGGNYEFHTDIVPEYEYNGYFMLTMDHPEVGESNLVSTSFDHPDEPGDRRYFTPSIFVEFFDDTGDFINYPEEEDGGEYRLEWNRDGNESMGQRTAQLEQHGSDGSWGFHIRADYETEAFPQGDTDLFFSLYYCEGGFEYESHDDPQDETFECETGELELFQSSSPLSVYVDEYENTDENGRYPHERNRVR